MWRRKQFSQGYRKYYGQNMLATRNLLRKMETKRLHVIRIINSGTDNTESFKNLILTRSNKEEIDKRKNNGT